MHLRLLLASCVLVAAACSAPRASEPATEPSAVSTEAPAVSIQLPAGLLPPQNPDAEVQTVWSDGDPITVDDLDDGWPGGVAISATWDESVLTIVQTGSCGTECAYTRTVVIEDRGGDALPEFVRQEQKIVDYHDRTETVRDQFPDRLEISEWDRNGVVAGRTFVDGFERGEFVFWFDNGSLVTAANQGDVVSDDEIREALASSDHLDRIDALAIVIMAPEGRQGLLPDLLGLLGDTERVPTTANWSWRKPVNGYWPTQGPYEVVGEHAAIAIHFVLSPSAVAGANFLEPTALYVAIDWVGDSPQANSQRVEQVAANWLAYADAHNGESSDPSSPLAGLYFRALDSCPDLLLTESGCIQTVHLLCNNIAIWNEGAALTFGPFTIEDGVATLDGESGGAPLPIGPDNTYPYGAELTRHQFNGKQCR